MTLGKKTIVALADYKAEYYTFLKELIAAGKIKPIIDRRYPLEVRLKGRQVSARRPFAWIDE